MAKKNNSMLSEWQKQAKLGGACSKCFEGKTSLTVDHIIPVTILNTLDETGEKMYEWQDNFQLLCRICNVMKAGRLDKRNPRTKDLLLELLED